MDNPQKRVLYVITKATWGGAQRYVWDLMSRARAYGYDPALAYGEEGLLAQRARDAGFESYAVHGLQRDVSPLKEFAALRELAALFARLQPDVVHLNSSKASALGALAARLAGVPRIIFTAHGWAWNESRPWWQKLVIRKLAWLTVALSHATVCVSHATAADARWMPFVRKKFAVIHNGIACGELPSREAARAELAPQLHARRWIGMASELHPTKRVKDALHAFRSLAQEFPDTALLVMGEGAEHAKLDELIGTLELRDRVLLLGFVADASRYLSAFDIFLHSSQSDTLAYAVLEAGCASLPTVATRVGGIPEIIEDGVSGLLVPPRSPDALADALAALLCDSARAKQFGAALHQKVLADFSKQKMLAATLALY